MSSTASDLSAPRRLLAIDVNALGRPDGDSWTRLGDRIAAMRRETVLVYIGTAPTAGLPEPDYQIDDEGESITRHPGEDTVEDWPPEDGTTGIMPSLEHLAHALLIPWSEVYCVLGPDRPLDVEQTERVVVLGGDQAPELATWVPRADEDAVIAALEVVQLFGGAAVTATDICDTAFDAAIDTLRRNVTELGFTAASVADNPLTEHDANYAAVWARDAVITGLWTIDLGDAEFIEAFRRSLQTLARHQAPSGQIPSNVRLATNEPDYSGIGGIASIDSVLWFVIGSSRFAHRTKDQEFAHEIVGSVEAAMRWLAAHDANNDALIEIPESSDWMDIFPRSYNVLYDEVLWWQACLDTASLLDGTGDDGQPWRDHASRIHSVILDQFWPSGEQLMEIAGTQSGRFSPGEGYYMLSQITPFDYGWSCDVYANLLAALSGMLDERRLDRLFTFLWGVGVNSPFPVTCLYPPIASGAEDWKDYFLVNFLNLPDHYHNGGIWPFIGGLWVRFLTAVGRVELAHRELTALAEACRQGADAEWEFNEWLHGRTGRPMGKAHQAWSAASYVNAYRALRADAEPGVFPALDPAVLRN